MPRMLSNHFVSYSFNHKETIMNIIYEKCNIDLVTIESKFSSSLCDRRCPLPIR